MELREILRKTRQDSGLNQIEWAKLLGISKYSVLKYEKGTRRPGYNVTNLYVRHGASLNDLFPHVQQFLTTFNEIEYGDFFKFRKEGSLPKIKIGEGYRELTGRQSAIKVKKGDEPKVAIVKMSYEDVVGDLGVTEDELDEIVLACQRREDLCST